MSNLNGWGLTARLISKHFGVLGDKISEAIANFDPETATEADRDRLADTLRQTAQKLAAARASFDKEHEDVVKLRTLIATDEKALEVLADRLATGKISEATVTMFCDELEANKSRLPVELQEQQDAQDYMNELQKIVDAFSKQLADFDAAAKKALQTGLGECAKRFASAAGRTPEPVGWAVRFARPFQRLECLNQARTNCQQ